MKFLHIIHGYSPNIGGEQLLFQQLSERLVKNHNDSVTVFTTNALSNYHFWQEDNRTVPTGTEKMNGVTVQRFPVFNRFSWLRLNIARLAYKFRLPYHDWFRMFYNGPIIFGLTEAIAQTEADVVVAGSFPLLHMIYALRGAQKGQKPVLFHGALHPADQWGFDRQLIYDAIMQVDGYLANTSFEQNFLVNKGVDPTKITVTGAGVDADMLARADGRSWRQSHQFADEPIIAFVGQQVAHKGIDTLLQAMPKIWQTLPLARLVIAGKPTGYSQTIHTLLAQLPPAQKSRVLLLDAPPDDEKNGLLAACDLLALPSRHESFGMVLAEAWACGKPVIGCRVDGVAALVEEEKDGLLIPVGDATALALAAIRLLQNPALRHKMGAAGKKKVESRYTWDAVTAVYREACVTAVNRFQQERRL